MRKILCISGSTRAESTCMSILQLIADRHQAKADFYIYPHLAALPHFDPDASEDNLPQAVTALRAAVSEADAVIFCTPEYIFSMPSILKNALEWCVGSTVFTAKPAAMIVASAVGVKTYDSLALILKTIQATTRPETMLLLQGVRAKLPTADRGGDAHMLHDMDRLFEALQDQILFSAT